VYLRRNRRTIDGETYESWTLVESVRTARGPRQHTVATLGKLPGLDSAVQRGWEDIDALLEGRPSTPTQLPLPGVDSAAPAPAWREVDVRGTRVERVREFGGVYLALALWRRLGLHTVLRELLAAGREAVPWETVACLLSIARFCGQLSELGVAERWFQRTALDELLGVDWTQINDDRLYRGLDALHAHKEKLSQHLLARYQSWFAVRFEFLLYDVTSTFFEGEAEGNTLAARGYSRDSRPDCPQVCIGLVVTPEGLPVAYEVFKGNRVDVTTVEGIVTTMEEKYGQAERIWVLDRGMVSEDNLAFLRERKASYIVGTPKAQLRQFEAALLAEKDWQRVREDVEVKLMAHPDGQGREQFVLCRSAARREKEKAMLERQAERLLVQLVAIDTSLRKNPHGDLVAVGRRIGRWLGRYPAANKLFVVEVLTDAMGAACALMIACRLERSQWAQQAHGAYLLRTNCLEKDPARLWQWYLQLTQAEAAFRTEKSDLHLRPIFHQKTERVEAHILVCFLALALWRTLEMWMKGKGLGTCARHLLGEISTIKSLDVVLPVRTAEGVTELRLRTVAKPERLVAELLQHLGLHLPSGTRVIENVVEKNAP
jgi:transposase